MNRPFVSIIVPTRNRAHLLRDCVHSLLAQDYPRDRYEIIVVDDGSADETHCLFPMLPGPAGSTPVRYYRQPSGGSNRARNKGISEAEGAIVGFVDDDEIVPRGLVCEAVRLLDEHPEAAAVGGWYRIRREMERTPFVCRQCRETFKGIEYPGGTAPVALVDDLPAGCLFVRRQAFDVFGLFDDTLSPPGDDTEWCVRVSRQGGRFLVGRDLWVWHRVLASDFRPGGLWSKCGRPMKNYARARRLMGWQGSPLRDVAQGFRFVAHGLRRGCLVGLVRGAGRMALAWQCLLMDVNPRLRPGVRREG
jgi:GT2 family glycosyltransferase